jgi:hypothetical protein
MARKDRICVLDHQWLPQRLQLNALGHGNPENGWQQNLPALR